jgi:hypothetical protein
MNRDVAALRTACCQTHAAERIVGQPNARAAIIVKRRIWRHNCLSVKIWVLNATDDRASTAFAMNIRVHWHLHATSVMPEIRFWTNSQCARTAGTNSNWMRSRPGLRMPGLREDWRSDKRHSTSGRFLDLNRVRATANASCISILAPRVRATGSLPSSAASVRWSSQYRPPFEKQLPEYLKVHAMVDMPFTPTHSSAVNQAKPRFGDIDRDMIACGARASLSVQKS